jgi:hypothetical protein
MMPASDDLSLNSKLDSTQLNQITTQLDLVMIALAALTQIGVAEMRQAAQDLKLESIAADWMDRWQSRQSSHSQQLDLEVLRALVLIANHLAQQHQTLVRRNITYWEQTIQYGQLPLQSPSLADYINNFIKIYQDRIGNTADLSLEVLSEAALKLLIELLFYGSANGHQRLWGALLQRAHSA